MQFYGDVEDEMPRAELFVDGIMDEYGASHYATDENGNSYFFVSHNVKTLHRWNTNELQSYLDN